MTKSMDTELVTLIENVVKQIKSDLELGQTEELEILLSQVPKDYLWDYVYVGE